jgi:hypothetical protein
MMLGMSIFAFTLVHVAISLTGIAADAVVLFRMLDEPRLSAVRQD